MKTKPIEKCDAVLCHGPGHQSKTRCILKGRHDTHYCIYGSYRTEAYWKGMKKFTGFFDEPPNDP